MPSKTKIQDKVMQKAITEPEKAGFDIPKLNQLLEELDKELYKTFGQNLDSNPVPPITESKKNISLNEIKNLIIVIEKCLTHLQLEATDAEGIEKLNQKLLASEAIREEKGQELLAKAICEILVNNDSEDNILFHHACIKLLSESYNQNEFANALLIAMAGFINTYHASFIASSENELNENSNPDLDPAFNFFHDITPKDSRWDFSNNIANFALQHANPEQVVDFFQEMQNKFIPEKILKKISTAQVKFIKLQDNLTAFDQYTHNYYNTLLEHAKIPLPEDRHTPSSFLEPATDYISTEDNKSLPLYLDVKPFLIDRNKHKEWESLFGPKLLAAQIKSALRPDPTHFRTSDAETTDYPLYVNKAFFPKYWFHKSIFPECRQSFNATCLSLMETQLPNI